MTRPITWTIWAGVAAAIVGGTVWTLRPRPIRVETAPVVRGTLEATVTAEGKTRVKDLFVVAAPVDGELERIPLKVGEAISPATVVARIWPIASRPLDARSRAEAVAAVSVARAGVQRAEAAEREAEAALTHAQSTRDTAQSLADSGAVATKDAEHAQHELEIRRQAVKESQAAVQVARADAVRTEAAAAASSPDTGRVVTPVHSPTSGRILRVVRESAGPVTAGTPLVELGNTSAIEIASDFLTTDAMTVRPGAPATIRDWGGAEPLAARVRQVDPGAFTKVSALGLEEQRVSVVLDLVGNQPPSFGNDFHVNVYIVVWKGADVLTVPSTALFRVGDNWAVFVVRDGRARMTKVIVGRANSTRSVIQQGLDAGEDVVVQPSDALQDGSRVVALQDRYDDTVR